MDCGRIPPPQRGWEGVFLKASEHRSIIRSMTALSQEAGKSDTIYLWDYMKTLCVMLPDQELHSLDMTYGDPKQDFNKLEQAYKSLEDRSQYWVTHLPQSRVKQATCDSKINIAAQLQTKHNTKGTMSETVPH